MPRISYSWPFSSSIPAFCFQKPITMPDFSSITVAM